MSKPFEAMKEETTKAQKQALFNELRGVMNQLLDMAGEMATWKNAAATIPGFQYKESAARDKHEKLSDQRSSIVKKLKELGTTEQEWTEYDNK